MHVLVYIHNMYKWMRISGMRTSNWAGSWHPPTGQPLGQGFLEMCPMVPSKHSFAKVPCTCASDVCTCITNEMRMLQITNDMCILH